MLSNALQVEKKNSVVEPTASNRKQKANIRRSFGARTRESGTKQGSFGKLSFEKAYVLDILKILESLEILESPKFVE